MGLINGFCYVMIFVTIGVAFLTMDPVAAHVDIDLSCGKDMSKECGEAIGRKVAQNQGPPVSNDCCAQLVKIGKPCHDSYAQQHIKIKDYVGTIADLLKRSDDVWNGCVAAWSPLPTPGAF